MAQLTKTEEAKATTNDDLLSSWREITEKTVTNILNKKLAVESYYEQNTRPDGRLFSQYRPTTIEHGIIFVDDNDSVVNGSARIRIGHTHVIATVTSYVGQPSVGNSSTTTASTTASSSEQQQQNLGGEVIVSCTEAFPTTSSNSQSSELIRLQSYIQRIVDGTFDMTQLLIDTSSIGNDTNNKSTTTPTNIMAAYGLQVSITIVKNDGNIMDACILGAVASLDDTYLPSTNNLVWHNNERLWLRKPSDNENDNTTRIRRRRGKQLIYNKNNNKKSLSSLPVPLTIGIWYNNNNKNNKEQQQHYFIVDPTKQEEDDVLLSCSSLLTVVVNAPIIKHHQQQSIMDTDNNNDNNNNNDYPILSFEFSCSDGGGLDPSLLTLATKIAQGRAREIVPILTTTT